MNTETEGKAAVEQMADSLTLFDQIAIEQMFRKELEALSALTTLRALRFVQLRRDGKSDGDAFREVAAAPISEISDAFDAAAGADVVVGKASEPNGTKPGPTSS